jgi:CRP/FNR family transcriptional regulator, cyclic AMP receptor protein
MSRSFPIHELAAKLHVNLETEHFPKGKSIFVQGDRSDAIFYVEQGAVALNATSSGGKEATIGLTGPGTFFGEGCLALRPPHRPYSAVAFRDVHAVRIKRMTMLGFMARESELLSALLQSMLSRYANVEADLASCLLHSSQTRLARALCTVTQYGGRDSGEHAGKVSQQTLAGMAGITRQHVNALMTHFRKSGFIEDADGLKLRGSLLRLARG